MDGWTWGPSEAARPVFFVGGSWWMVNDGKPLPSADPGYNARHPMEVLFAARLPPFLPIGQKPVTSSAEI